MTLSPTTLGLMATALTELPLELKFMRIPKSRRLNAKGCNSNGLRYDQIERRRKYLRRKNRLIHVRYRRAIA